MRTVGNRIAGRLAAIGLVAVCSLSLARCGGDEAAGPRSCGDIGDEATAGSKATEPAFKVIAPNGGESFKVGDSISVRFGANSLGTSALAYLIVERGGVKKRLRLPGTPSNKDINPRADCTWSFRIPDSLVELGTAYPLVSDDVKVRIAAYNSESLYFDESDGKFRITP